MLKGNSSIVIIPLIVFILWLLANGAVLLETPDGHQRQILPNPTVVQEDMHEWFCERKRNIRRNRGQDPNAITECQPSWQPTPSWLDEPIIQVQPVVVQAPAALQALPTALPCDTCFYEVK